MAFPTSTVPPVDASPAISAAAEDPVVSIREVTHRYRRVLALDGISLDIPPGIMVGIVGPDGVGKSTLLGLIAGAKKMQEGRVTVLGGDIGCFAGLWTSNFAVNCVPFKSTALPPVFVFCAF